MTGTRFQVASSRTGRRHAVDVWVYDTKAELVAASKAYSPDGDLDDAGGVCHGIGYWTQNLPTLLAVVRLTLEQLDLETVVHEVTHAATHIYGAYVASRSWDSRARTHLNAGNETLAHLVGELSAKVHVGLAERGFGVYPEWHAGRPKSDTP